MTNNRDKEVFIGMVCSDADYSVGYLEAAGLC